MENQLALLSTEQATSLIHSLGLGPVCSLLQNHGDNEILSNIPEMDPASLQSFLVFFSLKSQITSLFNYKFNFSLNWMRFWLLPMPCN